MDEQQKIMLLKAGEAFKAIESFIEIGAIKLDTTKYECEVLGEVWTMWIVSERPNHIDNVCRNIMMYCDAENSRLIGSKVAGAYKTDVYFHAMSTEHHYYLGKFNRLDGLILPD